MKQNSGNLRSRIILALVLMFALCLLGGFASIHSSQSAVPQPWATIRHLYFSTNGGRAMAHFRFKSNFPFDVFNEVAVETKSRSGWESPQGPLAYEQLASVLKAGDGQDFSVKIPKNCDAWRVLVRSTKATLSGADERRARLRAWLESHYAAGVARYLALEGPGSYETPGPEMQAGRNGKLPSPR